MRCFIAIAASFAFLLAGTSPARATPPLVAEVELSGNFRLGPASALCGFDIFIRIEGTATWRAFVNQDGEIIREVDTFPQVTWTIYAPSQGTSYTTRRPAMVHTSYTPGAAVGSSAVVTLSGLVDTFGPGPGIAPGRISFNAIVTGYHASGIPLIRATSVIDGTPNTDVNFAVERCAAMTA